MKLHTQWSDILQVVKEAQDIQAGLLVTLDAGSPTDRARIIALITSPSTSL